MDCKLVTVRKGTDGNGRRWTDRAIDRLVRHFKGGTFFVCTSDSDVQNNGYSKLVKDIDFKKYNVVVFNPRLVGDIDVAL